MISCTGMWWNIEMRWQHLTANIFCIEVDANHDGSFNSCIKFDKQIHCYVLLGFQNAIIFCWWRSFSKSCNPLSNRIGGMQSEFFVETRSVPHPSSGIPIRIVLPKFCFHVGACFLWRREALCIQVNPGIHQRESSTPALQLASSCHFRICCIHFTGAFILCASSQ